MAERGETLLTLPTALVLIGRGVERVLPSGNQLETPVTKIPLLQTFEPPLETSQSARNVGFQPKVVPS